MRQILRELELETHPDKTEMGQTRKGFSFLGFKFKPFTALELSATTTKLHVAKLSQLLERGAATAALVKYCEHWAIWAHSHLKLNFNDYMPQTG
jgi:hypothetical protein